MKNLKWEKSNGVYLLNNNQETVLSLSYKLGAVSTFTIGDTGYEIIKKGFFNPAIYVMAGGKEILRMQTGLWESKGTITFGDGTVFRNDYKTDNKLAVRFLDGENEILNYSYIIKNNRPKMTFKIGMAILDAEKLLVLAALGMVMFSPVFKEMSADDEIITLV